MKSEGCDNDWNSSEKVKEGGLFVQAWYQLWVAGFALKDGIDCHGRTYANKNYSKKNRYGRTVLERF